MDKNCKKNLGSGKVRKIVEGQVKCFNPGEQNAKHQKHTIKTKIASDFDDILTDIKEDKKLKINTKSNEENANIDCVENELIDEQIEQGSMKSKRKRKKKAKISPNTTTRHSDVESSNSVPKQNKRKKNKKEPNQGNNEIDCEEVQLQSNKSITQTNKNITVGGEQMSRKNKKNKKIIFTDDVSVEVALDTNKQNVKKQNMNDEETLINDEEIDRFCDEIDDQDNAQYEDWVKLLEAKLGNNKK